MFLQLCVMICTATITVAAANHAVSEYNIAPNSAYA